MKFFTRNFCVKTLGVFSVVLVFSLTMHAEVDPPQRDMRISPAAAGTFAADWQGEENRIYFLQWSMDFTTWHYAPLIDFGDGEHSRGVNSSANKSFFRLHCVDFPGITTVDEARNADFDADGLSNIFEVSFGFDPFDAASSAAVNEVDADGDGLTNGTEYSLGLNPALKDHPVVELTVDSN